VRYCTIS